MTFLTVCALPIIINLSSLPIVKMDYKARKAANKTCKAKYKSCLTRFYKTDFQAYRAICGGPVLILNHKGEINGIL